MNALMATNREHSKIVAPSYLLSVATVVILFLVGVTGAYGRTKTTLSSHHREALNSACADLHPESRSNQVKCRVNILKNIDRELLDFDDLMKKRLISSPQLESALTSCEGIKFNGPSDRRLIRYDECLRKYLGSTTSPEPIPPPTILRKPDLILVRAHCSPIAKHVARALDNYRSILSAELRKQVKRIKLLDEFYSQFWCTNRSTFFKLVLDKHPSANEYYVLFVTNVSTRQNSFHFNYVLQDVNTRNLILDGPLSVPRPSARTTASAKSNQIKRAAFEILSEIASYQRK